MSEILEKVRVSLIPSGKLSSASAANAFNYVYDQIVAVDGVSVSSDQDGGARERTLRVPTDMAARLRGFAGTTMDLGNYNCHSFARVLRGLVPPDDANIDNLATPVVNLDESKPAPVIPLGMAAVVGWRSKHFDFVPHSVIGLGNYEGLQVSCNGGFLGIVDNEALLAHYGHDMPKNTKTHLYPVPDAAY